MNKMVLAILVPLLAMAVIIFFGVPAGAYIAERAIGEPQ